MAYTLAKAVSLADAVLVGRAVTCCATSKESADVSDEMRALKAEGRLVLRAVARLQVTISAISNMSRTLTAVVCEKNTYFMHLITFH